MTKFVIDASIAAKWLFDEPESELADLLLSRGDLLLAPDLLYAEIGNVVWKRLGRGELDLSKTDAILDQLLAAPVKLFPISRFMRETVRIAHRYRRTFYDASYLALAIQESCALITADLRLLNALRDTPMRDHVRPLSEAMLR
ncbi:MAG TPA: type II toxin-antitoxin system VapC family toxin [Casimicrobiaceae bacterium]